MFSFRLSRSRFRAEKHRYIFYHHSYNVKAGDGSCPGVSKSAPRLEAAIIEKIREMATAGWIEQIILEEVQSRESGKRAPVIAERDQILLEVADLGEKFSQWADRLV